MANPYRNSMASLDSLDSSLSISADFGSDLLSSLNFELSKFDISLPETDDKQTVVSNITEEDLEASAAVANADAIIEHFEKLDTKKYPRFSVQVPPKQDPEPVMKRSNSLTGTEKALEKKAVSFEEMLQSGQTKFLSASDSTSSHSKPAYQEIDEFEKMLTSTKTKHISATPDQMSELLVSSSSPTESNVHLRRPSVMGKGKNLFSMLMKPQKNKAFSGISSDDFNYSPHTLVDAKPVPTSTSSGKPLPPQKQVISREDSISSLLPPIVHKLQSGDTSAIKELVESTYDTNPSTKTLPKPQEPIVEPKPKVASIKRKTPGSVTDMNSAPTVPIKESLDPNQPPYLNKTLNGFVTEIDNLISELSTDDVQENSKEVDGLTVATETTFNVDDAQDRLQDLLDNTHRVPIPRKSLDPKRSKSSLSQASVASSGTSNRVTLDLQLPRIDIGLEPRAVYTNSECQAVVKMTDSACSPLFDYTSNEENTQLVQVLQQENSRLIQELETMKLLVTQARSQTQQMKILKEAAEARFEQLARVAHRKLVRAMVEKQ